MPTLRIKLPKAAIAAGAMLFPLLARLPGDIGKIIDADDGGKVILLDVAALHAAAEIEVQIYE